MDNDLVLILLNEEQISRAKQKNGKRKKITHALVAGSYGIMFGTEQQCRKYYLAWRNIFKHLFFVSYETNLYPLNSFIGSDDLEMNLIEEADNKKTKLISHQAIRQDKPKKKWFLARWFGA